MTNIIQSFTSHSLQQFTSPPERPYIVTKTNASEHNAASVQSFIIGLEYNIMEFSVPNAQPINQWRLGFSGQNEKISAIAAFRANARDTEHAEKRARKSSRASLRTFLCAGTLDAKMLLWEGSTLKAEFKIDSGARVMSIAPMQDNSGRIFVLTDSSSEPLHSIHYSAHSLAKSQNPVARCSPKLAHHSGNEKFTSLATFTFANQSYLLIGTNQGSVHIVDTVSMTSTTKLIGHTAAVNKMAVSNGFLVTSSDSDLFVNVYDLRADHGITTQQIIRPFKNLQTPSEVTSVDVNLLASEHTLEVCAVCTSKTSLVWRFSFSETAPRTSLPTSVEVDHTCHVQAKKGIWVGGAAFTSDTPGQSNVVFLMGSALMPHFQRVNQLETKIMLTEQPTQQHRSKHADAVVDTNMVRVVGAKRFTKSSAQQEGAWSELRLPEDVDTQKVAESRTAAIPSKPAFHKLLKRQSEEQSFMPEDITSVFVQCVSRRRFEDIRFKAIMSSIDRDVVHASVRSLPADHAQGFFEYLDEQVHATKSPYWKIESAMVWLTAVLAVHGRVLQRVKDIDLHLKKSMQIAQERIAQHNTLLSLSGKLDMLLGMAKYPLAHFDPENDPEFDDATYDESSAEIVVEHEEDIAFFQEGDEDIDMNL